MMRADVAGSCRQSLAIVLVLAGCTGSPGLTAADNARRVADRGCYRLRRRQQILRR